MEKLLHKIIEKEAIIGIIGLGHTGLSLAHDFGAAGFKIIGYDIDTTKIEMLHQRKSYLPMLPLGHLFYLLDEQRFVATSDPKQLSDADIKIISVPTPLSKEKGPDISYILKATETVGAFLGKDQLVVLQSTTYPGTTREQVAPLLEKITGLKVGQDFFLSYVPEREDAGNPLAVLTQIPRICGGMTRKCLMLAKTLYENITVKVHPCSSTDIAEATKAYENTFRLINIAFVDEMKMVFDKMGINIWEVIEAASTKPFGFTPFYPGPGIGGECIPVDPIYLAWRAEQFHAHTSMIEIASSIGYKTIDYVIQKMGEALKASHKNLSEAKILILGAAFKKDLSDIRESPSIRIIHALKKQGVNVDYHDFFVPSLKEENLHSISLTDKALQSYDCVVIATDHSRYDWNWVCQHSRLILDTRNATKLVDQRLKEKIIL